MRKRLTLLMLLSTICITFAQGQNARTILDKAADNYYNSNGAIVKFSLDTKDISSNTIFSQDGTAYMKGDKFKIEIPDAITWFDGNTQWTYIKGTDEVNVTNPSGAELQAISPSVLFSIYKKGYDLNYKGERNRKGKTVLEVEMIANTKGAALNKIVVEIEKANNNFSRIILTDTNNMENTLTINSYKSDQKLNDNTFSFNKSEYPEVEIIDLR